MRFPPASLALALLAAGCAERTPALRPPPELRFGVQHHAGPALRGSLAESAPALADADAAILLRFGVVEVERFPSDPLVPVSSRARLIARFRGNEALLASTELLLRGRVAPGGEGALFLERLRGGAYGRPRTLCDLVGLLVPGATTAFQVEPMPTEALPPVRPALWAEANLRSDGTIAISFTSQRWAKVVSEFGLDSAADGDELRFESVAFDDALSVGGAPWVLAAPLGDVFQDPRFLCVVIRAERAVGALPPDEIAARAAELAGSLGLESSAAAARSRALAIQQVRLGTLERALPSIENASDVRGTFTVLAVSGGADLAADCALVADDATLRLLLEAMVAKARATAAGRPAGAGGLAFMLEATTYRFLASRIDAEALTPELRGILLRHAGEVGRSEAGIEEMLASAKSLADLRAALRELNALYLEHPDPSTRVRAYDWLRARGIDPAGYDPLGPAKERRRALEAAAAKGGAAGGAATR